MNRLLMTQTGRSSQLVKPASCRIDTRPKTDLVMRISHQTLAFFALAFLQTAAFAQSSTYKNPIDGRDYIADWERYEPETPKNDVDSRVAIEKVVLLTAQDDVDRRISVESLATYIEQLEADLLDLEIDYSDHGKVLLQVEMGPEQPPAYTLAYDGSISTDLLQAYYERASSIEDAPGVLGPVSFQLFIVVRDFSDQLDGNAPN